MSDRRVVYLDEFVRSLRDGDLLRGRRWLHGALELDPGNPGLALRMGDLHARLGQPRLAADWLEHAARLADGLGQQPLARQLLVRACAVHAAALEPAVAYAHQTWGGGDAAGAAGLLEETFQAACAAGTSALWSWLTVAIPVARAARSVALAIDATCGAAAVLGPETLCFHLSPGAPAAESAWPLEEATFALLELGDDAPPLLSVLGELAAVYLASAAGDLEPPFSVAVPPRSLLDPRLLAAGVSARRPSVAARPPAAPGSSGARTATPHPTSPCHRAHRPRPWQIPASIEALRQPSQPVMPRELFVKLPAPMRRAVVWLEADRRRAARAQAAAASAGAR